MPGKATAFSALNRRIVSDARYMSLRTFSTTAAGMRRSEPVLLHLALDVPDESRERRHNRRIGLTAAEIATDDGARIRCRSSLAVSIAASARPRMRCA